MLIKALRENHALLSRFVRLNLAFNSLTRLRNQRLRNDRLRNDRFRNDRFRNDRLRNDRLRNDRLRNDRLRNDRFSSKMLLIMEELTRASKKIFPSR